MEKLRFYFLKVPLMLVLICFGYLIDFVLQLPFWLMCRPNRDDAKSTADRR